MKRYYTILNILLITVAVYFAVQSFYTIITARLDDSHFPIAAGKQMLSQEVASRQPLSYYNTIIQRNLFNTKTGIEQKSKLLDIETLKPTKLKLKLLGTVTGDASNAYAVIKESKGKNQDLYRVGDTIQTATIKSILRERVVLNVNGKDEILVLEDVQLGKKRVVPYKRSGEAHSENVRLKHSQITDAIKNINNLMGQVRVRPYFENGKPAGISLAGIKADSIFKKMGLKNGDIIKGVDGKDIESVDDILGLYNDLKSSSNVRLQIKRRGRLKTIDYNIE